MSKIAIDAREWSTSTGRYISNLVRRLEKLDSDNDYIVLMKPSDLAAYEPTNSAFKKMACSWEEFTLNEQLGFKKQLDGLGADLVHFGMPQQPIRYRGRTVTTIHDLTTLRFSNPSKNLLMFRFKQQVYKYVIKRAVRKSARVIVGSQFVADDVAKFSGIDPVKITVTYEAADPISETAKPLPALKDKQFLMYVGRPTPHKNLERLIEAFEKLQAQYSDLLLVLAGKQDANYRRIETSVQKKGLEGIVFTGFVSEGQLRWLYENCAAYVFPSLSEGFGLPGLEAMVQGAPVVSSNATCLPEIYGDAAHYFDPLNVDAMAQSINDVLTDQELRQKLIAAGHKQVQKYSWQRTAEQTLEVYAQALRI